jgi:hypothetical protein
MLGIKGKTEAQKVDNLIKEVQKLLASVKL